MSIFDEYIKYKKQIESLEKEMERLRNSPEVKEELERREDLAKRHEKHLELIKLEVDRLTNNPEFQRQRRIRAALRESEDSVASQPAKARKERRVMVYKNPHSGEVLKTKGANHKKLREWRDNYGASEVRGWRVDEYGKVQAKKHEARSKALISDMKADPDVIRAIYLKRMEESNNHVRYGRKKPLYVYKNPNTDEVVVTRSGSDKTLNKWRLEFGRDAVKSWFLGMAY